MKYYIEKDSMGKIISKGVTINKAILNDGQIELTEEEFNSTVQYKPHKEEVLIKPTIEERLSIAEDTINFLLGL